jgi:hypothetical protein
MITHISYIFPLRPDNTKGVFKSRIYMQHTYEFKEKDRLMYSTTYLIFKFYTQSIIK